MTGQETRYWQDNQPDFPPARSIDQNLLLGVLSLQMDLIDSEQFAQACTLWSSSKQRSLGEILVDLGAVLYVGRSERTRQEDCCKKCCS
ncbi:MAG TPA: hypothetical protein DCE43_22825 [Planctomycetaceae bacterium]|nr:hypothetical protein [Planctomycetaceae bacterium]HCK53194.1 hypothetical protein [Planctomycetaceae bacterium]